MRRRCQDAGFTLDARHVLLPPPCFPSSDESGPTDPAPELKPSSFLALESPSVLSLQGAVASPRVHRLPDATDPGADSMKLSVKQFSTVTGLTIVETLRQPVCLLVAITCIALISLLPLIVTHTLGEAGRLVRDSALAFHVVCGMLLGSFAACSSLAHEIRRGTASAILSKPVSRELFFLAKFAGIGVVMLLFSLAASIATIMSVRMAAHRFAVDWWAGAPLLLATLLALLLAGALNYFARRPFVSGAFVYMVLGLGAAFGIAGFLDDHGHAAPFGSLYAWKLVPACLLIALAVLTLSAVAVSLATRFDVVPTVALCSAVFLLGLASDYLFGRHADAHATAAFLYAITPNWQHFWAADALSGTTGIPWSYVFRAGLYAIVYMVGVLALGMASFRLVDV